jgi:hypothetical protein
MWINQFLLKSCQWLVLALVLTLLSLAVLPTSSWAEVRYEATDQAASVLAPDAHAYVSGRHMVWIQEDDRGIRQVFYRSMQTGETKQLTTADSSKSTPVVSENADKLVYVAWIDRRTNGTDTGKWTVWGMNVAEGREKQISAMESIPHLSMDGHDLVWFETNGYKMYYYNFGRDEVKQFGSGRYPVVAKGSVLYINVANGGLSLYRFATTETVSVLPLPRSQFVTDLAFNGTVAIYKQSDSEFRTKVALANVSDPHAPQIADLTPQTKKDKDYPQLFIGDQYAAWVQDQGGTPQLNGVNLVLKETYPIERGDAAFNTYAFDQNRLVLKNLDGKITYRTITRFEIQASGGGYDPVPSQKNIVQKKTIVSKVVGSSGGELDALDGRIRLTVASGALTGDTSVKLALEEQQDAWQLHAKGNTRLQFVSRIWSVSGIDGDHPGKLKLAIGYDPVALTLLEQRKLSVFRYDDSTKSWIQLNGRMNLSEKSVIAEIPSAGVYALVLNDVSYRDVERHWAKDVIEPLAARGIINGMTDTQYAPDEALTRAQFVKLLTAAIGEKPSKVDGDAFTDVVSAHWAAGWIEKAAKLGLVEGSDGRFDPEGRLTREQMIVMLARAMGQEQVARALKESEIAEGLSYGDAGELSDWARAYASQMTRDGLIEGSDGMLKPKQSSTRAEAAAIIYRFLERQQKL